LVEESLNRWISSGGKEVEAPNYERIQGAKEPNDLLEWSYENDCQPQGDAGRRRDAPQATKQAFSGGQSITPRRCGVMAGDDPPSMVQFLKPWWLRQAAASGSAHSRECEERARSTSIDHLCPGCGF